MQSFVPTAPILDLISQLLVEFDISRIRYVHWKSNTNIARALSGADDFDVLVHPEDRGATEAIFAKLRLIRAKSVKDHWQENIYHYVAPDVESCSMVHVHVHYALPVGFDYDKNFVLPVVDDYLATRWKHGPVYLPEVEMEYAVLVLRLIIKNSLTPFCLELPHRQLRRIAEAKRGVVSGSGFREFLDLAARIDRGRLEEVLSTSFGFVDRVTFELCETAIRHNKSLAAYFHAGALLKRELKAYATNSPFASFFKAFWRINRERVCKLTGHLFRRPKHGKMLTTGGRIIAFVGGDGAGKSTNVEALYRTLRRELAVTQLHIGRPPRSIGGLAAKILAKTMKLMGARQYWHAFVLLSTALDRKAAFQHARGMRQAGWVVVVDRVPLPGITRMDCPRIHLLAGGRFRWLAALETRLHQTISGVDELIVLKLDPVIALQRRPEDDAQELMLRSGEIWNNAWDAPYASVIDTGANDPRAVQTQVLVLAWACLSHAFQRMELLGLSGAGKSTAIRELARYIPNMRVSMPYRDYPWTSIQGALWGVPTALRAWARTRNMQVAKNCLQLFASWALARKFKEGSYPATHLLLDQGPAFQYGLAEKEGILSGAGRVKAVAACQLLEYTMRLVVPSNVLLERVVGRGDSSHIGRAVNLEGIQQFQRFCSDYEEALDKAQSAVGPCFKIDASGPPEVVFAYVRERIAHS